jgi:hypothetical protein
MPPQPAPHPEPFPLLLSRAHYRHHGRPLLRYYTFDIKPMQQVLRQVRRSDEVGLPKALHICRGHFKDYRRSGLFGKHQGLYWFDMHVRGTAERGVVVKDYAVQAPSRPDAPVTPSQQT